jgi:hypothetical protein
MSIGCLVKRAIHILFFVFLTVTVANGAQSSGAVSLNSPSVGSTVSGAAPTPITEPPGAYVLPSNLCGVPDASAGLQAALDAAKGRALWIPDGCTVNTSRFSLISSNTTIACGQGVTIHSMTPMTCNDPPPALESRMESNITVEGCTFTGDYTPSMAAQLSGMCGSYGVFGGAVPAAFYAGSNITFTDNAVTNEMGGVGLLFDQTSNVTISNNYFAYSYENSLQLSNCKNCNVTGNTSLDANWNMEDAGALPAGYDTGTWSNNTFACDSTGVGFYTQNAGWRTFLGGTCPWTVGIGCSEASGICTPGEYSGVTVQNNTITGPGASLVTSSVWGGSSVINNSFTNGGVLTPR